MSKTGIYKIWKQFTTIRKGECLPVHCVQRTNIQNLKAIHNGRRCREWRGTLCSKNEYTKSESNSQLTRLLKLTPFNCVQRTNIQNLKAIHNYHHFLSQPDRLCSKNEYTKSESNSQRALCWRERETDCVQRTNIQNLKAIHNPFIHRSNDVDIVFKERIYKIWKQFTTAGMFDWTAEDCVQRTNIQNLKAIHNAIAIYWGRT